MNPALSGEQGAAHDHAGEHRNANADEVKQNTRFWPLLGKKAATNSA